MSNISNTRFKGINRCFAPCIPKHNPTYNFTSECSSSQKDCVNMKIWTYMNKNRCHRTSEDSHLYPHMCAQHSKVYNMNTEWDKLNDRQKKLIVLMSKDITPAYLLMCLPEFMRLNKMEVNELFETMLSPCGIWVLDDTHILAMYIIGSNNIIIKTPTNLRYIETSQFTYKYMLDSICEYSLLWLITNKDVDQKEITVTDQQVLMIKWSKLLGPFVLGTALLFHPDDVRILPEFDNNWSAKWMKRYMQWADKYVKKGIIGIDDQLNSIKYISKFIQCLQPSVETSWKKLKCGELEALSQPQQVGTFKTKN